MSVNVNDDSTSLDTVFCNDDTVTSRVLAKAIALFVVAFLMETEMFYEDVLGSFPRFMRPGGLPSAAGSIAKAIILVVIFFGVLSPLIDSGIL